MEEQFQEGINSGEYGTVEDQTDFENKDENVTNVQTNDEYVVDEEIAGAEVQEEAVLEDDINSHDSHGLDNSIQDIEQQATEDYIEENVAYTEEESHLEDDPGVEVQYEETDEVVDNEQTIAEENIEDDYAEETPNIEANNDDSYEVGGDVAEIAEDAVDNEEVQTEEVLDTSEVQENTEEAFDQVYEDNAEQQEEVEDGNQVEYVEEHDDVVEEADVEYGMETSEVAVEESAEILEAEDEDVSNQISVGENEEDAVYEDAVEVEEEKQNEYGEEENVAQHVGDSDEDGEVEDTGSDGVKLGHVSDDDLRGSDDEDTADKKGDSEKTEGASQAEIAKMFDSDSDAEEEKGEGVGNLIHDIFGESDDENEEFTGFGQDDVTAGNKARTGIISDSDEEDQEEQQSTTGPPVEYDSDEGIQEPSKSSGMVYDFDVMLQKKKAERKGRRRRDGGTMISDSDDIISAMLAKMKDAADADKEANQVKKPALNKLKMLQIVVRHLKKQDLKEAFVDMGMVAAIADWLSLLPDRSLPHLSIRTELLKILHDMPPVSAETLKSSGVGKSVMILFKHPRETRNNRESAGRLINKWSRPIFGLNDNFKSMTRGEREQRDLEQMPQAKRRRLSSGQAEASKDATNPTAEQEPLRPGDRGFVMRARVPMPSHKDYVVRPKWNVNADDDDDEEKSYKKRAKAKSRKDERLEKHIKNFAERRKHSKMQRAVGISLEGNKMPLT